MRTLLKIKCHLATYMWAWLSCFAAVAVPGVQLFVVRSHNMLRQAAVSQRHKDWAPSAIWTVKKGTFLSWAGLGHLRHSCFLFLQNQNIAQSILIKPGKSSNQLALSSFQIVNTCKAVCSLIISRSHFLQIHTNFDGQSKIKPKWTNLSKTVWPVVVLSKNLCRITKNGLNS